MNPNTIVQCARCQSPNVYVQQAINPQGTASWEVHACLNCDWPHDDSRPLQQLPEDIQQVVDDAHENPQNLVTHEHPGKKLEDLGERPDLYPEV